MKRIEKEDLRRLLLPILKGTDEQKPKGCNVMVHEVGRCIHVTGAFQDHEGIIWFNVDGNDGPVEFDDMSEDVIAVVLCYYNFL